MKRTIKSLIYILFGALHSSAFTSSTLTVSVHGAPNVRPFAVPPMHAAKKSQSEIQYSQNTLQRRNVLAQIATAALIPLPSLATETNDEKPFHSAAYGQEEYTNSIVASRDTNISPREVYDTIASDYLKNVLDVVKRDGGVARALDVGAGEFNDYIMINSYCSERAI